MLSSNAKNLLLYLVLSIFVAGCGAPSGGGGSDESSSSGDSGASSVNPPSVEVLFDNGDYVVGWNDVSAASYRVLYWQGNDAPGQFVTASTSYTLPPLASGDYTVIVEAYDELGNSLFSKPVAMEVL